MCIGGLKKRNTLCRSESNNKGETQTVRKFEAIKALKKKRN